MRSLGTRRVAKAAGAATVAVIALVGCSAGQHAETAVLKPPISGLNTQSTDGGLLIRNLQVIYNNPAGYAADASAPLELSLFNQTQEPITVQISSAPAQGDDELVVSARQVSVGALATPSSASAVPSALPSAAASASAAPEEPALKPARFTIPPMSTESFMPGDPDTLQLVGLSKKLIPGGLVNLTFEVSTTNQPIQVQAPFGIPHSPASRAPGEVSHEGAE